MHEVLRCPWCQSVAEIAPDLRTLSKAVRCACGALGFCANVEDTDEIVDDAIDIFGVRTEETSRGFTDLLLADVVRAGVDVRGGPLAFDGDDPFPRRRWIWFRKPLPVGSTAGNST